MPSPDEIRRFAAISLQRMYESSVNREVARIVADADRQREEIERVRSVRRNRNRALVLIVAFTANLSLSSLSNIIFHSTVMATYAPSVALALDLIVTMYAWHRRY